MRLRLFESQDLAVLHKCLIEQKLFCLLKIFREVAQNSTRIPCVFHVHKNPEYSRFSRFVVTLLLIRQGRCHDERLPDCIYIFCRLADKRHKSNEYFTYCQRSSVAECDQTSWWRWQTSCHKSCMPSSSPVCACEDVLLVDACSAQS